MCVGEDLFVPHCKGVNNPEMKLGVRNWDPKSLQLK